ncbi:fibronectin type III domain-containing protein, partial [Haloarcula pellucida]
MPVQFTTSLPDVGQPDLGNGVEDEIQVSWTDVINYGEHDVQYRETTSSTWLAGPTVDDTASSATITGLEDGEAYEVRIRTQTEHVTGAWTDPV